MLRRGLQPIGREDRSRYGLVLSGEGLVSLYRCGLSIHWICVRGLSRRIGNLYVACGLRVEVYLYGLLSVKDVVQLRVKGGRVVQLSVARHLSRVNGPLVHGSYVYYVRSHGFIVRGRV